MKKIGILLLIVATAGGLFAESALAYDRDWHDKDHGRSHEEWREHHAPAFAYNRWYPRAWYEPAPPRGGWHWRWLDGRWRWMRW